MRYIKPFVIADLQKKMVFIGGPRQVGKTTLSLDILGSNDPEHLAYLNWDVAIDRKKIRSGELPLSEPILIFDEIHKFSKWRNLLKGIYDKYHLRVKILVTGSARLDIYRRGGDSLLGRYRYWRLHPFSVGELGPEAFQELLTFGGFPEPFLAKNEDDARRWRIERNQKILYEDLRDLENVRDLSKLELLLDALPSKVGSPISLESLRIELDCSHSSIRNWLEIFEKLYLIYRIPPFGSPKIRAVKKEQKLYFWDWAEIEASGARFENMVASQLLKYCHFIQDSQGHRMELRYLKDTDGREVDFIVLKNKKPEMAVEVKVSDKKQLQHVNYFRERTQIKSFYMVHQGSADYGHQDETVRILPFTTFCNLLQMP